MWWVADLQARKLVRVSVSWPHSGAAPAVGLKLLGCVEDRQGIAGAGGVRMAGGTGAAPDLNIDGGLSMTTREHARSGSLAGLVAMATCCCCG